MLLKVHWFIGSKVRASAFPAIPIDRLDKFLKMLKVLRFLACASDRKSSLAVS